MRFKMCIWQAASKASSKSKGFVSLWGHCDKALHLGRRETALHFGMHPNSFIHLFPFSGQFHCNFPPPFNAPSSSVSVFTMLVQTTVHLRPRVDHLS